jgi:hypothetical protein
MRRLVSHACIPAIKALDDANKTTAWKPSARAIGVSGIIGQEMGMAVVFVSGVSDIWGGVELEMIISLGDGQGCVDSWGVEISDEGDESRLRFWC